MHLCPFWYEWHRIGVFFGFLLVVGGFFLYCWVTPPSPLVLEKLFFVSFSLLELWIRLSGLFFRMRIFFFCASRFDVGLRDLDCSKRYRLIGSIEVQGSTGDPVSLSS